MKRQSVFVVAASLVLVVTTIYLPARAEPVAGDRTLQAGANAAVPGVADSQNNSFGPTATPGSAAAFAFAGSGSPNGDAAISSTAAPGGLSSASAASIVQSGGAFFSSSNIFSGRGGGEIGAAITAFGPPLGTNAVEAGASLLWRGVFTAQDTLNHRFGFHVERMALDLFDSTGLYDQNNPLTAKLGGEIRFGLGTGPLDPSDALYRFVATLTGYGSDRDFALDIFNPTGAAVPVFTEMFGGAFAPAFDAFVNLGVIPGGAPFVLEYLAFTYVGAPGTTGGVDEGSVFGSARFGDPFGLTTDPIFTFQTSPLVEIPEPISLLGFGLMLGISLSVAALRS
jgi:hypothetical protein